jgi:hypothetical protein
MLNIDRTVATGSHGEYLWLTTAHHDLRSLLHQHPQVVLGKYIAVTSHDSGPLAQTDVEKRAGWECREEIGYSPQIQFAEGLQFGDCAGFDEWYIFDSPSDLGRIWHGNVFEAPNASGQICVFVNFLGFALHDPEIQDLVSLFWNQLDRIRPESYVAHGSPYLTFASRDKDLFASVLQVLNHPIPK